MILRLSKPSAAAMRLLTEWRKVDAIRFDDQDDPKPTELTLTVPYARDHEIVDTMLKTLLARRSIKAFEVVSEPLVKEG